MNQEQELIAKIHAEFDSAQERLLSEAVSILQTISESDASMANRLASAGFNMNPIVKRVTDTSVTKSAWRAELITYYKQSYPFLKFLTEDELDRICDKYNLVHAAVDRFIGNVPVKNLNDIEQAQPLRNADFPKDKRWAELTTRAYWLPNGDFLSVWDKSYRKMPSRIDGEKFDSIYDADRYLQRTLGFPAGKYLVRGVENFKEVRTGRLFICAPASYFDLDGLKQQGRHRAIAEKEIVKDPIVFRYVRGGIQVITKWGLEASDPALVNEIMN